MQKWLSITVGLLIFMLPATSGYAATYDLTGTWNYTLSGNWATGDIGCNPGQDVSGTCSITQTGESFTFAYTSGVECNPAESCTFSGAISGNTYSCSTTDIVDDENGSVTSTIIFSAASATSASGSGSSLYTHPSGEWTCAWGSSIALSKIDNGGQPTRYALTAKTTGDGTVMLNPAGGSYDPGTIVEVTAVPNTGWQFDGWTGDVADHDAASTTVTMDADKTVTAAFDEAGTPDRVTVSGSVSYDGSPVCAMVLANGQYMFTCQAGDEFGKYQLDVPLDANGKITLQAFVSNLAPYRLTTDTSALMIDIAMQTAHPDKSSPRVSTAVESGPLITSGWARISGTVDVDGAPLCAMVLANGKYMFSCNAYHGIFDLTVPLDSNNAITLYVFVSGFRPYKEVLDHVSR